MFIFSGGQIYIGYWKDGKGNGLGVYILERNMIRYGFWEEGKQNIWFDE